MEGPAVSRGFLKDLKLMDSRLGIKFNGQHFVIVYTRPIGEPANIYRVKADDGGFRYPDTRDLIALRKGDLSNEDMQSRLRKLSAYSENLREKAKADAADNIRAMTKENRTQLTRAAIQATNQGKANATYRRIDPKVKGKTWEQIQGEA